MEKKITRLYWVLVGILLAILIWVGYGFEYHIENERMDDDYRIIETEQVWTGKEMAYVFTVPAVQNGRQELAFYTVHQDTAVFLDGELVYSLGLADGNAFGKTSGRVWNYIPITEKDAGKEVKILITSPYENNLKLEPVFYFGEKSKIVIAKLVQDLFPMGLAILTFFGGILLIGFVVYTSRDSRVDKSLAFLGVFAVLIALWQFFDLPSSSLLFPYSFMTCYIPLLVLMLVPIPFVSFVRRMHKSQNHPLWSVMCGISVVNILLNTFLQVMRIADFRETLWITHITFGVVISMGMYMLAREWRTVGLSPKLKLNLICVLACAVGSCVDVIVYYNSSGSATMVCGLTGFLIYVVIFGINSVIEARHLMAIGKEAEKFEKMAYHDQLTGLYNRLAWVDMVKKIGERKEEYMVIMMDLNDLKKCNDSLGHDCGDKYIQVSAKLMEKAFGNHGTCFRMGGDEFCVLFHSTKVEIYMECMDRLLAGIRAHNEECDAFPVQIAYGVASFDRMLDYDLNDTRSRADAAMYHRKFKMKNGEE